MTALLLPSAAITKSQITEVAKWKGSQRRNALIYERKLTVLQARFSFFKARAGFATMPSGKAVGRLEPSWNTVKHSSSYTPTPAFNGSKGATAIRFGQNVPKTFLLKIKTVN